MDVWGPAHVSGQGRERYFLLVVDDYTRDTTVFPLRSKGKVSDVLIPWICTFRLQLRERFGQDLPVRRLHSDRGGEFSSDLLRDFCRGEGITQSLTLPDSPQKNGIAERRIGLVMEVARTSMIHAAAPHFLWSIAVRYAVHQLNLWPRVSLPETSPTLRWTGKVGDASVFRVWGSRAFDRDTSADKLSARAIPCVFLGFVPDTHGWHFTTPPRAVSSRLRTSRSTNPLPGTAPVQVVVVSGAAPGAASRGAASGGVASGGAEPGGAGSEGAGSGGAEPMGVEPGGAELEGVESEGAEPRGPASSGGPAGTSPRLSLHQLREWLVWRTQCRSGAPGAGHAGDTGAGGTAVPTGAGGPGGTAATSPGCACTSGAGAVGSGGVGCAGAGDPTELGAAGAGGARAGVAGVGGPGAGGAGAARAGVGDTGDGGAKAAGAGAADPGTGGAGDTPALQPASPLLAPSPYTEQSGGLTECREPASRPISPVRTACRAPCSRPPPVFGMHTMALRPSSVPLRVPLPTPPKSSLPEVPNPVSDRARAASPTVARLFATAVTDPSFEYAATSALVAELLDFAAACRLNYATALVADSQSSCPPSIGDIPTPRSYAEAITGPYSSQWQAAMDAEMASWKSTGTYVDAVPPSRANIVDGMWIFRVKRPPGSPPAFKAHYVARGFSQRQGVDYFQTFSPTPKMTTLRVLLHVAAQRTQWSLRRLVYDLRQAPREWHDTLRTTLAALGFAPSTAGPSLFLRTDTSLPPFYVLVYVDDLVFATSDTEALTLITRDRARRTITVTQSHMVHQVLQRFGFQYSSPQLTLSTSHSLSAPPSDESVELSGPYPELVGCLMYLMTCTRPDIAYPLSLLACYVAPVRHRKVHWDAAKRVLRYLCSTLRMGLVLGGRSPVVLTGHADASWVDNSATQRSSQGYTFSLGSGSVSWRSTRSSSILSSSCEAEIYAGAMAAQELRWLTYLLTDLGEQPRSPPVLYVDNKAMIALCQEHILEHRTKHIALRYFLARDLQQRGQLRLAYVATRANTADVFTKALPPGGHQRFATVLGLGCSPSPLAPSFTSATAVDVLGAEVSGLLLIVGSTKAARARVAGVVQVEAGVVVGSAVEVVEVVEVVAAVGVVAGVGALVVVVEAAVGVAVVAVVGVVAVGVELFRGEHGAFGGSVSCLYVIRTGDRAGQTCGKPHTQHCCFSRLDDAWRAEFGDEAECPRWAELLRSGVAIFDLDYDVILAAMYALSVSAEGVSYQCVPPDPGIEAAALGASEYALPGTAPAEALHTFTLDLGASRCFFSDSTTLTPLFAPVPVRLADPSGGPFLARSSIVLPCLAVPSSSLSSLHLPSFSTNLVSTTALQDAMVTTTTLGVQRVSICTCTRTGRHLATFTRRPGLSLYTLAIEPPHVATSAQVSASGPVAPPCFCRLLSHKTLLWHHRLGHPSLPRLRGMHSRLLVSGLPRGGEFSSDLLRDFCRGEGILQSFTLPASPQQNGIAERRIGLVMEVSRTSMIHAAAPHFLWLFAVRYAAHQLNL
ncbi:unnamed protein product [Closterium sp. NIES-53]